MKIPTVEKAFCCCSLEVGGLCIGWISVVYAAISLIAYSVLATVDYDELANKFINRAAEDDKQNIADLFAEHKNCAYFETAKCLRYK